MSRIFICLLAELLPVCVKAQTNTFPAAALQEDFRFIRQQLFNAHANPFSVLSKEQYTHYLDSMEARITTPLSAEAFLKAAVPALAPLDDEYSGLSLPETARRNLDNDLKEDVRTNITYTRYGRTGYLLAHSFSSHGEQEMAIYEHCIDSIFHQIHQDGIKQLLIDVSHNTGGNSGVDNMIINHIWNKPYMGYSCNWRRSDEYLGRMKAWHSSDEVYKHTAVGDVIHFDRDTLMPPENGHPMHFGENYAVKLPNTKIQLKFGVKEWIRPAGKTGVNKLIPDIPLDMNLPPEKLIKKIPW